MVASKLVITSSNVQLPNRSHPVPATVEVDLETGKITKVTPGKLSGDQFWNSNVAYQDLGSLYLLPGLVDAHVHLNEPGRTDWEGFYTGTRAAVAGGFTTVVDMPLNSIPPTTTVDNFRHKLEAATGQCYSDVAFWGGVIPGNHGDLLPLINEGVKGFKCFLIESGVEEFPCVAEEDVSKAMKVLEPTSSVLLFHAELECQPSRTTGTENKDPKDYKTFLDSRPDSFETSAIELIIRLNKQYPSLRTHIVHLSSAPAIPLIKEAKAAGLPLTVETCFHYLCLTSSEIPAGHPEFKCCPPIRTQDNREELWNALRDGTIDFVVSDHSPSVAELKCLDSGDIMKAWGGIGGLGLGLSLLWTEARKRGVTMGQIVEWLSLKTAKHVGLAASKGSIEVGKDADFVVFNSDAEFKITKEGLNFKNKVSPYVGLTLTGKVERSILRGRTVWDCANEGIGFCETPSGRLL